MAKRITVTELAQGLGVSVCTVNKALPGKSKASEKTRQRVIDEAHRLGYRPNRMAQVLARNPIRLAYLHPAHFESFFAPFEAGVRLAAHRMADQQVSVSVHKLAPVRWGKALLTAIRTLVRGGFSGVILSPMAEADYSPIWDLLAEHGVPLVQLGLEAPDSPAALTVRQDTFLSGRMAAELLSYSGGPVALMIGSRRVVDHDEKVQGLQSEAQRRRLPIAAICEHDDDPEKACSVTRKLLAQRPELRGVYVATDNFGGIAHALKQRQTAGRVTVVATGVFPEIRAAMEVGLVHFALDQRMAEQAGLAVHQLHELLSLHPDPAGFLKTMGSKGISVNLWVNMFISKKAPIYPQLAAYTGSHTYWLGQVPDYTFKAARDILMAQHRRAHLDIGVSGYKIDEVDELPTEHMLFPSGLCGEQMRQIHGLVMQKAYLETFRQINRRTCGLVRGSNAGGSPYPFALYSDTYEHRGFIQALANSSMAGVLWCSEVRDGRNDEDWVRRFQTALFSPIMQLNAWSSGLKPWSRPGATDMVRDLLKMRMRLVPYIYTSMADYQRYGIPPIRHMIFEEGYPAKEVEVSDQYMFGPSILVAPMIAGEKSRRVALPKGKWFDFYTGKLAGEESTINVPAPLDQIPLFVKDGGIVPLMAAVNNARLATGPTALEVRHYGSKEGVYQLYDDDGETFDYEKGISSRQELRVVRDGGKLKGETGAPRGPWRSRYCEFNWRFMTIAE